jgi:hypothetical protein
MWKIETRSINSSNGTCSGIAREWRVSPYRYSLCRIALRFAIALILLCGFVQPFSASEKSHLQNHRDTISNLNKETPLSFVAENPGEHSEQVEAAIPGIPGWYEIPNSQLFPLCPDRPDVQGNSGCQSVISAWNSGIADTKRERLLLWGGGHSDYLGNELYALDLKKMTMLRLTDPSPVTNVGTCPEAYVDGSPSARHTYNGLVYNPKGDAMFAFGGSKSNCGYMSHSSWRLGLEKLQWEQLTPKGTDNPQGAPGYITSYDSRSGMIYLFDTANFFTFDPERNQFRKLSEQGGVDYHLNGTIDEGQNYFIMAGGTGQFWAINLNNHSKFKVEDWSRKVVGCEKLMHSAYPGLAYYPPERSIVGWTGGDSVVLFHLDKMTCEERTYPDGPGPALQTGSNGRFRYFPSLGVFALVNNWKQNAFLLRLNTREAKK